jgi:hypothetical protein
VSQSKVMSFKWKDRCSEEENLVNPVEANPGQLIPPPTPATDTSTPRIVSRRHRIDWRLVSPRAAVVTRSASQSTL